MGFMQDRFIRWAESPYGGGALFVLSALDSVILPVVPHPLMVALALAHPHRAIRYALEATAGSVLGGALGYFIGWKLMVSLGQPLLAFYGLEADFDHFQTLFQNHAALVIFLGGISPIPYKIVALSAGAADVGFWSFTALSLVVRGGKFLALGWVLERWGGRVRAFMRQSPWVVLATAAVVVVAFSLLFVGAC